MKVGVVAVVGPVHQEHHLEQEHGAAPWTAALPREWLVLGAGGHAASVTDVLHRAGGSVVACCTVTPPRAGVAAGTVRTFDDDAVSLRWAAGSGTAVALGVGEGRVRTAALHLARSHGAAVPAVCAVTATVACDAVLGDGAFVAEHAHVGPGAQVGDASVVNTAAVVEHHAHVGAAAHCAPGSRLLGAARLGPRSLLGAGATVLPGVRIGRDCTVGDGRTVVGVPAREVHRG